MAKLRKASASAEAGADQQHHHHHQGAEQNVHAPIQALAKAAGIVNHNGAADRSSSGVPLLCWRCARGVRVQGTCRGNVAQGCMPLSGPQL